MFQYNSIYIKNTARCFILLLFTMVKNTSLQMSVEVTAVIDVIYQLQLIVVPLLLLLILFTILLSSFLFLICLSFFLGCAILMKLLVYHTEGSGCF